MQYILNKNLKNPAAVIVFLILLGLTAGCAHHDEATFLYPGQYALEGYTAEDDTVIFEDRSIKITARQIMEKTSLHSSIAAELLEEGFVLLNMEITNKSRHRALYDPALTSLRDSKMGYFKPLDFTDLYMLKIKKKGISSSLTGSGEVFYDLAERVGPGKVSSKLLVFRALTENADEAELVMKSIYIGKDILDLTFNFVLKPKDEKDKEVTEDSSTPPITGPLFK